jgi:NADPH-dependent 2,4-dienoyl-CoA reductase/sulfur reductase-like enzyme
LQQGGGVHAGSPGCADADAGLDVEGVVGEGDRRASAACIRWATVRAWAGVVRGRIADMDLLDVTVVGGGQAGLAIARRLRRLGLRFLVLDASPEIGQAGSVSGSASHPKPALPIGQAQQ